MGRRIHEYLGSGFGARHVDGELLVLLKKDEGSSTRQTWMERSGMRWIEERMFKHENMIYAEFRITRPPTQA